MIKMIIFNCLFPVDEWSHGHGSPYIAQVGRQLACLAASALRAGTTGATLHSAQLHKLTKYFNVTSHT